VSFLDDLLLGIKNVLFSGTTYSGQTLELKGAGISSVATGPTGNIVVTVGPSSGQQSLDYAIVPVFGGSTTLTPDAVHDAQCSTGTCLMQIPAGQSTGAWFGVLLDGTPSSGAFYEVLAPGSGSVQLPLGPDVTSGNTYASTASFIYAEDAGSYFEWVNLGGDRYGLK
jgi:hypothetical protein